MATPLAEPYGRPRDYVWRMAGLGRPVLWSMAAATAVSAVAAVAASAWALYETRTADDRVQRWVVWVDGTAAPIGRVPIGKDWSPNPGAYVDFAERWIRNLRSRPTDLNTLKLNRRHVIISGLPEDFGARRDVFNRMIEGNVIPPRLMKLDPRSYFSEALDALRRSQRAGTAERTGLMMSVACCPQL